MISLIASKRKGEVMTLYYIEDTHDSFRSHFTEIDDKLDHLLKQAISEKSAVGDYLRINKFELTSYDADSEQILVYLFELAKDEDGSFVWISTDLSKLKTGFLVENHVPNKNGVSFSVKELPILPTANAAKIVYLLDEDNIIVEIISRDRDFLTNPFNAVDKRFFYESFGELEEILKIIFQNKLILLQDTAHNIQSFIRRLEDERGGLLNQMVNQLSPTLEVSTFLERVKSKFQDDHVNGLYITLRLDNRIGKVELEPKFIVNATESTFNYPRAEGSEMVILYLEGYLNERNYSHGVVEFTKESLETGILEVPLDNEYMSFFKSEYFLSKEFLSNEAEFHKMLLLIREKVVITLKKELSWLLSEIELLSKGSYYSLLDFKVNL